MTVTTGLSGNEIFCLAKKKYIPGNIVVGNSIHSLGIIGSVGSGFKVMSLLSQALVVDKATFYDSMNANRLNVEINRGGKAINRGSTSLIPFLIIISIIISFLLKINH